MTKDTINIFKIFWSLIFVLFSVTFLCFFAGLSFVECENIQDTKNILALESSSDKALIKKLTNKNINQQKIMKANIKYDYEFFVDKKHELNIQILSEEKNKWKTAIRIWPIEDENFCHVKFEYKLRK